MAITRNFENANRTTDFTPEIEEIGNQFSLISDMGLVQDFNIESTNITFDRIETDSVLVPQSNRGQGGVVKGQDNRVGTYTLQTPFHKHTDGYSKDDILNYRKPATAADVETSAALRMEKLTKLRRDMDLTQEYMKLSMLTGTTVDGYGNTIADMFAEFGVTRPETDFDLGNNTDVSTALRNVIRNVTSNAKMGMAIQKPIIFCGDGFFDKYVSNADVKDRYKYYLNSGVQRLRDSLMEIRDWGSLSMFEDRDVTIINYSPEFLLADGTTTTQVFGDDEGTVVVPNADIYHGYHAPSDREGDTVGREMFAFEDTREKGRGYDLELQASNLYINRKPLTAHRVFTTS